MDKTTHELRLADWQAIVNNCLSRPAGQSKKQWLAEQGVPEKSYYYWQRKIRLIAYGECHPESPAAMSSEYEFAELPFQAVQEVQNTAVPAAVIRKGSVVIELNNSINDRLLGRLLEVISNA